MIPALLIRLHPAGPWRFGPGEGGRDRVDTLYRSDRLYSALTLAFERLGQLERWLEATARAATPAVRFSSLFPFQGDTLFAAPPSTLWPPPAAAVRTSSPVFSTKVRWRAARFVPLPLIDTMLLGQRVLADQWIADAESGCLLRRDRPQSNPFRVVTRTQIAVDRLGSGAESHSLACIEFEPAAGLWVAAVFETEEAEREWKEPLLAAFRLLADTGLGGRRASGWGQISSLKVQEGSWPGLLLPRLSRSKGNSSNGASTAPDTTQQHWLLSLFTPSADDRVDWSAGNYSLTVRGGRTESKAGHGAHKKLVRMVEEGSVLASRNVPRGSAVDVAPPGFAHAVYRAGFALTVPLPVVDFGAAVTESTSTELEKALDEALKAAAEEGAIAAAEEKAESVSERFSEAQSSEREENGPEFGHHLESIPNAAEPGDNTSNEVEETGASGEEAVPDETVHGGTTGQNAPQTPFEEAPAAAPESEFPERLNVTETPDEKADESEMKKPEITESGSGDEI